MDLESIIRKNIQETKDYHEVDLDRSWADFKAKIGVMPVAVASTITNSFLGRRGRVLLLSVLALGVISLVLYWLFRPVKQFEIKTTIEKADTIRMSDGSVAYIQPHSTITYPLRLDKATVRQITVKGSAIFDVAKDTTRPFVVACGGLAITALGTVFLLDQQQAKIRIKGIEGHIEVVEVANRNNKVILKAGDEFEYAGGQFQNLVPPPLDTVAAIIPAPVIIKPKPVKPVLEVPAIIPTPVVKLVDTPQTKADTPKVIDTPVIIPAPVIKVDSPQAKIETPPIENLREYQAKSLVEHLERQSGSKITLARKTKYDQNARVKNDLSKDTDYILQKLMEQTGLKSRPGKCDGCIEIYSDKK